MKAIYKSEFSIEMNRAVPLIKCTKIPFSHGFSTRLGGVSHETGYETLDLGAGSEYEAICENRLRFINEICCNSKLVFAKQIHSSIIEYVNWDNCEKDFECDGFVTDKKGIIIAVKTADCVPILFCDEISGVIGAVHAGWRGTASGIAAVCIKAMTELGASKEKIVAAIGPCIHFDCYEVDDAFKEAVSKTEYSSFCLKHIVPCEKSGKYHADLTLMNRDIITSCGILPQNIFISGFCTCCNNDLFFSHRAGKGKRGLMMSGICL